LLFSDSYFTIAGPAEATFRDRGSKFIAYARPVRSEPEIKSELQSLKHEHASATHHCYAWQLGPGQLLFRANDDGEPSNTAGKPILSQIRSKDLTNILVVVVRYFGGTLLGVNGLINAYRSAASAVLAQATIKEEFILFEYGIEFDFDNMDGVMRLLKEYGARIISNNYDEKNHIVFRVRKSHSEELEHRFNGLYTAKLKFLNLV
jgi:uncharacterized YigZ family protein